jgi:hypothetical protein
MIFRPTRMALSYDRQTFYGGDAHGYTDYPFYGEVAVV